MNIGLFLGHPAHFHMLKNTAKALSKKGHDVYFVIKKKDILENLLTDAGYTYTIIRGLRKTNKMIDLLKSVIEMEFKLCEFLNKKEIDILIGSSLSRKRAHDIWLLPMRRQCHQVLVQNLTLKDF